METQPTSQATIVTFPRYEGSPAINCLTIRLDTYLPTLLYLYDIPRHGASGAVRCGAVRYLPVCLVLSRFLSSFVSLPVCACVSVYASLHMSLLPACLPTAQEAAT